MINSKQAMKLIIGWLITGTRGGETRAKILNAINNAPQNANQLSKRLNVDYKTVRHHLAILKKNKLITPIGESYVTAYALSEPMEENYHLLVEITKNNKTAELLIDEAKP